MSRIKFFVVFFIILFFVSISNASTIEPLKVLFIGNSYTQMNQMPTLLKKIIDKSGNNAIVEESTEPGASFKIHSERTEMYNKINSRKWDYIVLQGYSRELTFDNNYIDTATVPFLNKIIDSIYSNNSCTNILLFMTWGYDKGFLSRDEINTFDKMADRIEKGYFYLAKIYNIPVVPVGVVWKSVRKETNIDLYASDSAHPNINGSFLIATTFYNFIYFGELNTNENSIVNKEISYLINKKVQDVLQQKKYKLNYYSFNLKLDNSDRRKYKLFYSSTYSLNDTNIKWSFGDGKKSSDLKGFHVYKKPGNYTVRVQINQECGTKTFDRVVSFKKKSRIKKRKILNK